jgi:hypothetical protein
MRCVEAVETGVHDTFLEVLQDTGNTVCGRHPIGVLMAAVEVLEEEGKVDWAKVRLIFLFSVGVPVRSLTDCERVGPRTLQVCSLRAQQSSREHS